MKKKLCLSSCVNIITTYNLSVSFCLGLPSSRLQSDPVDLTTSDLKHSSLTGGSQPRKITLQGEHSTSSTVICTCIYTNQIYTHSSDQVIPIKPFHNPQSFLEHLLIVCWWDGSDGDVLPVGLPVVLLFQCLRRYMILKKYVCPVDWVYVCISQCMESLLIDCSI